MFHIVKSLRRLLPTHRKVSEKLPKKSPQLKSAYGALRYTFKLTEVAVKFPIVSKLSASL